MIIDDAKQLRKIPIFVFAVRGIKAVHCRLVFKNKLETILPEF